jgi:hypothetical protein
MALKQTVAFVVREGGLDASGLDGDWGDPALAGRSPERAELFYRALRQPETLAGREKLRLRYALVLALGAHQAGFNLWKRDLIETGPCAILEETTRRYKRSPAVRTTGTRSAGTPPTQTFEISSIA